MMAAEIEIVCESAQWCCKNFAWPVEKLSNDFRARLVLLTADALLYPIIKKPVFEVWLFCRLDRAAPLVTLKTEASKGFSWWKAYKKCL